MLRSSIVITLLLASCACGHAKTFPRGQGNTHDLKSGDSFSVECKNIRTGVIDKETVDVDAHTATVSIPGQGDETHRITSFFVSSRQVQDRFGDIMFNMNVEMADWGQKGNHGIGLIYSNHRWVSTHDDDTVWFCAN